MFQSLGLGQLQGQVGRPVPGNFDQAHAQFNPRQIGLDLCIIRGVRMGLPQKSQRLLALPALPGRQSLLNPSGHGDYPGVEVRLTVGNRDQLDRQLHDREIDLAIMGRPPRELAVRAEAFAANPLAVIAAVDHPLVGKKAIPPVRLDRELFIVRESGSGTRAAMEAFFKEQRIAPPAIMEMDSNETIKQAVIANM
eukprot:gene24222-30540_t